MNNKGNVVIVFIMVAIMAFIILAVVSKPLNEEITKSMNATNLDCNNATISTATKATCVVVDVGLFYFISSLIAVGIAYISGRRNAAGITTAIFVFVLVVVLITPLKDFIILARDTNHLNCAGAGITVGRNMACIAVDLWLFYFIATVLAAVVTYAFLKKAMPIIIGEK